MYTLRRGPPNVHGRPAEACNAEKRSERALQASAAFLHHIKANCIRIE